MMFFLWGASAMASAVAALLFLRFWMRTRERLFVWFATAFAILCLNWIGLATDPHTQEARSAVYLLRLLAFAVILIALIDENRRKR
jgi:hypothetical protein